jgi:periplasmic divalent cation tolerance protein
MTDAMLVLTTLPNADAAEELAKSCVTEKLAACANLFPALRSIYNWQAKVQDENEVLILFKTRQEHFERLKSRILELHPYEVPEVLAIPVEQAYQPYLPKRPPERFVQIAYFLKRASSAARAFAFGSSSFAPRSPLRNTNNSHGLVRSLSLGGSAWGSRQP